MPSSEAASSSAARCWNQLEPAGLLQQFVQHPPLGFQVLHGGATDPTLAFAAPLDLLTSATTGVRRRVRGWWGYRFWGRLLRVRTAFVGTTVSEYLPLAAGADVQALPASWRAAWGRRYALLVVKDIPAGSPLLGADENDAAAALVQACVAAGYVLLDGQALAHVAIDFTDTDDYLLRLSSGRRKNLRRKLKSLDAIQVNTVFTGSPQFDDERVVDAYHGLYEAVYAQSELHFDHLGRDFFAAVLRDAHSGGVVFEYRLRDAVPGALIGWNLCFESRGMLVDKYIGLAYPAAREHNLYFVSWFVNLRHALARGLTHYVAGWTDPEVKAQLGASFTFTRHAVYIRNPLLRALGRRVTGLFEGDRRALEALP